MDVVGWGAWFVYIKKRKNSELTNVAAGGHGVVYKRQVLKFFGFSPVA